MNIITNYNTNLLYVFMCGVGWDKDLDEHPEKSYLNRDFIISKDQKERHEYIGYEISDFNIGWSIEGSFYNWAFNNFEDESKLKRFLEDILQIQNLKDKNGNTLKEILLEKLEVLKRNELEIKRLWNEQKLGEKLQRLSSIFPNIKHNSNFPVYLVTQRYENFLTAKAFKDAILLETTLIEKENHRDGDVEVLFHEAMHVFVSIKNFLRNSGIEIDQKINKDYWQTIGGLFEEHFNHSYEYFFSKNKPDIKEQIDIFQKQDNPQMVWIWKRIEGLNGIFDLIRSEDVNEDIIREKVLDYYKNQAKNLTIK